VDLFEIALRDDPYPAYAALREEAPVHAGDGGYWYVTRYDDIQRLLRDPSLVAGTGVVDSLGLTEGPLYDAMTTWLMALDGPAHTRARRLISSVFTPRAVEALRPDIVAIVAGALDGLTSAGVTADLIATVAFPVPVQVMRLLFGVGDGEWADAVVGTFVSGKGPVPMMDGLLDYLRDLVGRRRQAPGDDMFSRLFGPDESGQRLSDDELVANGVLLITAGFETTMSLIGNMVATLFTDTGQLQAVRDDRSLVPAAVEEVLRFETPALTTSRRTTADVDVDGHQIPGGANVLFALAAGNRDPRRYPRPDRFDVRRTDSRPLGFGGGAHACIGAALARLEAQVVLEGLLDRFAGLSVGQVTWRKDNPTVRGPAALPVTIVGGTG